MGGKGALLLVLGFSTLFLVFIRNNSRVSSTAVDNLSEYYYQTKTSNIAMAGANFAAHTIFKDNSWDAGFTKTDFDGGTYEVNVAIAGSIKVVTAIGKYEGYENDENL